MSSSFVHENWVEMLFFILLLAGLVISIKIGSAFFGYIIIFLCGLFSGRVFYTRKRSTKFYLYFITFGFLIGYMLGISYGIKWLIAGLFVLGIMLSYWAHEKGIIE